MKPKQYVLGIDFGTTTLSGARVDLETRDVATANVETDAYLPLGDDARREQSLERLDERFHDLLRRLLPTDGSAVVAIGLTGQMHGVIGLDASGRAVTHLVTWQDRSGDGQRPSGKTLLEEMREKSPGLRVSNGYGLVTLYRWKVVERLESVATFCTVPDYFGMKLVGHFTPLIDPTMAHSVGAYDVLESQWDAEAIGRLGLGELAFPRVTSSPCLRGCVKDPSLLNQPASAQIGVTVALGDNQASFLGTVRDPHDALLVNIGTGSQISHAIRRSELDAFRNHIDGVDTELRPLMQDSLLVATCLTSGGVVYKRVHDFFAECGRELFGLDPRQVDEDLWTRMEQCGSRSSDAPELKVWPQFDGSRSHPKSRGRIDNIGLTNFTPGHLIRAALTGVAQYHRSFVPSQALDRIQCVYGSGNGLKKNALLRRAFEDAFGRALELSRYDEEAAVGAALVAASASGCPMEP